MISLYNHIHELWELIKVESSRARCQYQFLTITQWRRQNWVHVHAFWSEVLWSSGVILYMFCNVIKEYWKRKTYSVDTWAPLIHVTIFIIRLTHANVRESMGKPSSCTQFIKSRILLQVTRESISGTASHARICIRYYKSRALRLNVQWNQRFVW